MKTPAIIFTLLCASLAIAQPATAPSTAPATAPTILDGSLLQPLLNASVRIPPGTYRLASPLHFSVSGDYDLSGVVLCMAQGTEVFLDGDNIRLINPTFDSFSPATKPNGQNMPVGVDAVIFKGHNDTIDHGRWRNIDMGVQFWPHARGLTLIEPHFEILECRRQNVYCGAGGQDESIERGDLKWLGGYGKSEQEHPLRCSTPGFSGVYCYGVIFMANTGKECFAFRRGSRAICKRCTFVGTYATFVGENGPPSAACQDVTFDECDFHISSDAVGNFAFIDIRAATNVNIINNRFWPISSGRFAGQEEQAVSGNSKGVTIKGNTRYVPTMTPVGRRLRNMFDPPFVDGGGNENVVMGY